MQQIRSNILFWLPLLVMSGLLLHARSGFASPKVVVSVLPIHSLVTGIMQGVDRPELLIRGNQSPHDFTLRPSDMLKLHQADLVIWVGPDVESSLSRLFNKARFTGEMMALTRMDHGTQANGAWETSEAQQPATRAQHHDHATGNDSHIWLSPAIARRIVARITDRLCEMDPANAVRYRTNSRTLIARLKRLDTQLASMLSSVKGVPYVVFHDAYHHFEQHYDLNAVGAVSVNPERQPGARHIHELREKIARLQARCVFSEPQFRPKLVATLVAGTATKTGQLDPLGHDLTAGPNAYFELMRHLAQDLVDCLR